MASCVYTLCACVVRVELMSMSVVTLYSRESWSISTALRVLVSRLTVGEEMASSEYLIHEVYDCCRISATFCLRSQRATSCKITAVLTRHLNKSVTSSVAVTVTRTLQRVLLSNIWWTTHTHTDHTLIQRLDCTDVNILLINIKQIGLSCEIISARSAVCFQQNPDTILCM